MNQRRLYIFGEVLFDHFPDGKRVLGGAPFNVAWHLQAFGLAPRFISRVGEDAEGHAIRAAMQNWGMDTTGLQTDPARPTGKVMVSFVNDEPVYDIVENCAYDAIDAASVAASMDSPGFLYHGSLAVRSEKSRQALRQLTASAPQIVFIDVNLRPPWWQPDLVIEMLRQADWLKLNREELDLLGQDASGNTLDPHAFLLEHDLQGLVLTLGAAGAELHTRETDPVRIEPAASVDKVDTVGAGDAFASVIILGLVNQWPLPLTLRRAQDFASQIVGQRGATVDDRAFYRPFVDAWKRAH